MSQEAHSAVEAWVVKGVSCPGVQVVNSVVGNPNVADDSAMRDVGGREQLRALCILVTPREALAIGVAQ
jgi:hypothetical protein